MRACSSHFAIASGATRVRSCFAASFLATPMLNRSERISKYSSPGMSSAPITGQRGQLLWRRRRRLDIGLLASDDMCGGARHDESSPCAGGFQVGRFDDLVAGCSEFWESLLEIVDVLSRDHRQVLRTACVIGRVNEVLDDLLQALIGVVVRRPAWACVQDDIVYRFDDIVLDEDAAAVLDIVSVPRDLAVQDVTERPEEMLSQQHKPQSESVVALAFVRQDHRLVV